MSEELNVVNHNVRRVDSVAKVTGSARYASDIKLAGMLHTRMVRSPYPFARVKSIDTSRAAALEGVAGFSTHLDLVRAHVHFNYETLDDKMRYVGDPVVAVAAETEHLAEAAAALIKVEYEVLKPIRNMDEAMDPNGPTVWPGGNSLTQFRGAAAVTKPPHVLWSKGNMEKGLALADAVVDINVTSGAQFHVALEPHAMVAHWDRARQQLEIWLSTQQIHEAQTHLSLALGVPAEQVHVMCAFCGGGFGGKLETPKEAFMVSFLSRSVGRPVRYVPDREEEAVTQAMRLPARFNWKLGAKKNGKLTAISVKNLSPCGPFMALNPIFIFGRTEFVAPAYFLSDNCAIEGRGVYTNNVPTAAFRGFGYFESGTAMGIAVDCLCEKLGVDTYDFHMMNMPEYYSRIGVEQGRCTVKGLRKALTACATEAGWKEKYHKPASRHLPDGRLHGIGLGFGMGRASVPTGYGGAMIKIGTDGKAKLFAGVSDMGQGQATGCAQIAAESLGMKIEDVNVLWGDTLAPKTNYQAASATTIMTGNAVKAAGDDIRNKAMAQAARVLGVKPEEVQLQSGTFTAPNGKKTSYAELVQRFAPLIGTGNYKADLTNLYPRAPMFNVIEVAVDDGTGLVEILNLVQSCDCGRALSRSRVEGQMHGVLSGGIGFVLLEHCSLDEKRMRIANYNMSDYKIYTALDPNIDVMKTIIIEEPDEVGPYGARGMGEAVNSAAGPALANAVYNAIGTRIYEFPFTPNRILAALKQGKGAKA